jgi:1-hydroxycarotenoid 3,4-desaturase
VTTHHAVIVGAGIGGLSAALALAGQGLKVTVLEAQPEVGGKMRAVPVGGSAIDGGPTVFTMKWVFDELFDEAGLNFDDSVGLTKAELLARHAWDDSGTLDLFADLDQSADAIGDFCGAKDAANFPAIRARSRSHVRHAGTAVPALVQAIHAGYERAARTQRAGGEALFDPVARAERAF